MPARFAAGHDENIHARLHLRDRVLLGAHQRRDRHAVLLAFSNITFGGTPSALAISLIGY